MQQSATTTLPTISSKLGIGPGVDSPSLTLTGNTFTGNTSQVGVYIDTALDLSGNDFGRRVEVEGDGTVYSSIQSAIDAASDGDTITVYQGTYSESVSVSKSISLLGAQAGVDARSRTGAAESSLTGVIQLLADADNVTIDGFSVLEGATIGGANAGIFVGSGAAGTIIRNTIFTRSGDVDGDTYRGIVTTLNGGNTDLQIAQNRFSGWATGLYLNPAATDAAVSNNDFIGNFVGMSVDGPDNATISGNHFTDNQFEGLGIGPGVDSPSLVLSRNSFSGNTAPVGVYIDLALDLSGNTFDVTPDVLYGSGNSNGDFTVGLSNDVEVGLRIHDRFNGETHSNGGGTYNPAAGFFSGDSGPGLWNYDFSINLNKADQSDLTLFDDVTIELKIDIDPTAGTAFLTLDPLTTWTDNAYGDNSTANGDGDDTADTNANFGIDQNFYVVQNSQNIGWLFDTLGEPLMDVTEDATYDFMLSVKDSSSNVLASTSIQVNVGAGGIATDRAIDSLTFVDAGLGACVQQVAAAGGLTVVSEMTSLSCIGLNLVSTAGIGQLSALSSLDLSNNALTTIDVSDLSALQNLTILGNPLSSETLAYLASIDGVNGLEVIDDPSDLPPVIIPPPPPEEPEEPEEPTNEDIEETVENIVLPTDGEEVPEEVVDAIEDALDDVNNLADNVVDQLGSGDVSTDDAIEVLEALDAVLEVTGNAASLGADVDQEEVSNSVENISLILDALDSETGLESEQEELVQQITNTAVQTVADFIDEQTSSDEIDELITEVGNLLKSTGSAGVALNEDIVVAAKGLSNKALQSTSASLATEFGLNSDVDLSDPIQAAAAVAENSSLLESILDLTAVEVPSDVKVDTDALLENLSNEGLAQSTAASLTEDLSEFVNPVGVNLELGNGQNVNALDSMIDSVDGDSGLIAVDALTGGLTVDLGESQITINVSEVLIVPDSIPEGVTTLPDGRVLSVSDGVGVKMVPAPSDPIALTGLLSEDGEQVSFNTNGGITVDNGDATFSGTFGFDEVVKTAAGEPEGEVGLQAPTGGDPTDPDYTFVVTYADGSSQNIAPFVADESFFDSLETRGLSFSSSRSNGVVNIVDSNTGATASFRPDYFVTPLRVKRTPSFLLLMLILKE